MIRVFWHNFGVKLREKFIQIIFLMILKPRIRESKSHIFYLMKIRESRKIRYSQIRMFFSRQAPVGTLFTWTLRHPPLSPNLT